MGSDIYTHMQGSVPISVRVNIYIYYYKFTVLPYEKGGGGTSYCGGISLHHGCLFRPSFGLLLQCTALPQARLGPVVLIGSRVGSGCCRMIMGGPCLLYLRQQTDRTDRQTLLLCSHSENAGLLGPVPVYILIYSSTFSPHVLSAHLYDKYGALCVYMYVCVCLYVCTYRQYQWAHRER